MARKDSKYRSRNQYQKDRASAATRPAPRSKVELTPAQVALAAQSVKIYRLRLAGQPIPAEERAEYNRLFSDAAESVRVAR